MLALEKIWTFVVSYWEIAALVVTWGGIILVAWRKRADWKRKRFIQRVNFSLNYVEDGTLKLRTLLEDSAERVWLNDYGIRLVRRAAERTTLEQPFLRLAFQKDLAYVKRAVLNVLSERFSAAFVARAVGADVQLQPFVFGITWERYGHIQTQKLRVIIVRREELERIFSEDPVSLEVAQPAHFDRITTLRRMWELLSSSRDRDRRLLGEVELGVALPPAPASAGHPEPEPEPPDILVPPPLPDPIPDRVEPVMGDDQRSRTPDH